MSGSVVLEPDEHQVHRDVPDQPKNGGTDGQRPEQVVGVELLKVGRVSGHPASWGCHRGELDAN